jgi:hypothetical protein
MGGYRLSGLMYLAKNSADNVTEPIIGPVGAYKEKTVPQLSSLRPGSLLNAGPTRHAHMSIAGHS